MTTIPLRALHPRHGIHEPTAGSPARRPGSVRRTTTIDMLRPDGPDGPLQLVGRGRDLRTGDRSGPPHAAGGRTDPAGGAADLADQVVAQASCRAVVDFLAGRTLREITTSPHRAAVAELVGQSVASGFRRRLDTADPTLNAEDDLLYLLLDDLPGAALVSGHAFAAGRQEREAGSRGQDLASPRIPPPRPSDYRHVPDLCAGFTTGGTIMNEVEAFGRSPLVTGPVAPALTVGNDPLAWHPTPPLPPRAMRRARRIDVALDETATRGEVSVLFRDSFVLPEGVETVIHEYTVIATVDLVTRTFLSCEAKAQALPFVECPAAAASAGRLAGVGLAGLRQLVRQTFTGTSTCTHLNDTLRALQDVPALLEHAAAH